MTGRTCRVPTEACAYQVPSVPCLSKHLGQPVGVFGEVLEPHRAVLDEGDRLPVALHRHHDVEAFLADVHDRACSADRSPRSRRLWRPAAQEAEIAHQLDELFQAAQIVVAVVAGELGQQDRVGLAAHKASTIGRNIGLSRASSIIVRSTSSTAVGPSLTMCWVASIA